MTSRDSSAASTTSPGLLVISNGHGEDSIAAALIGPVLQRLPSLSITAFPVVGEGSAYPAELVVGPRKSLPAAGLTLHHPSLLLADLRAGLLGLTLRQWLFLRRQRPAAVLVVGDAYAQALAANVKAPRAVLQPLVSVLQERPLTATRLNRYFMESIRAPERLLLGAAQRVYTRDEPTAAALRLRGVSTARFLGNPVMDGLRAEPLLARHPDRADAAQREGDVVVALLPGTRAYAAASVRLMVESVDELAARVGAGTAVTALVAWTQGAVPLPPPDWLVDTGSGTSWSKGAATVRWVSGAFAAVLASADVVIGTAGTANEQAAGLGLPVVSFAVPPYYGAAFLENQERLLGGALRVVDGKPADIAQAVLAAVGDGQHRRAAREVGPTRLGGEGGTDAVADDLAAWLNELGEVRLRT